MRSTEERENVHPVVYLSVVRTFLALLQKGGNKAASCMKFRQCHRLWGGRKGERLIDHCKSPARVPPVPCVV